MYFSFGCVSRCLVVCPEERSPWRTIDPSSHPQKRSPHPILAKKGKTGSILRNLLVSTGYTYYARSLQAAGLQFASRKPLWSKATCICMHSMLISTSGLREATEAPAYGCDLWRDRGNTTIIGTKIFFFFSMLVYAILVRLTKGRKREEREERRERERKPWPLLACLLVCIFYSSARSWLIVRVGFWTSVKVTCTWNVSSLG